MDNLKKYQIYHDLIDYFTTLTSPKKSYLGPIFRTGGSIKYVMIKGLFLFLNFSKKKSQLSYYILVFRNVGSSKRSFFALHLLHGSL